MKPIDLIEKPLKSSRNTRNTAIYQRSTLEIQGNIRNTKFSSSSSVRWAGWQEPCLETLKPCISCISLYF